MSKPKTIEKFKNILLVVLFLSTILLLYFFWGNVSFDKIGIPEEVIGLEIPLSKEVIQPSKIMVSFGAGNYTVVPLGNTDVWDNDTPEKDSIVEEFNRFGQTENILVKEITNSQYSEIMKFRSIQAEFSYYIPFTDFCEKYQIRKQQSYDVIENISSIGYSEGSSESIFIYDGKNKKYYWLVADSDHTDFIGLIASIESKGYNPYYPLSVYLGVGNDTLIPLDIETNLRNFSIRQDSYVHQHEKINEMAERFFGESFDFIRKITEDNGKTIYMYGYGQKVLIVNTDGSFEYKEELLIENSSEIKFFDALDTALQFVAAHGSWQSLDGAKMKPYLKNVLIDPNKKKSYQFTFGMKTNGTPLFYERGESIVVEVTLGQVTYYRRNMIDFDQEEIDAIESMSSNDTYSPINMIAQNCEYIYDILLEKGQESFETDKNQIFNKVSSLITNMQIGYVKPADSFTTNNKVKPVWVVTLDKVNIYLDLYSAEPIGYSQE